MKTLNKKFSPLIATLFFFIFLSGSRNGPAQAAGISNPYTVDEVVASNAQEGDVVTVIGRADGILLDAGPDYEGPGGGDYLFGDTKKLHLAFSSGNLKLTGIITVQGKVKYCGGKKIAKYLCELTEAELLKNEKVYTVDELVASNIAEETEVLVEGRADDCICLKVTADYEGPGSGCILKGDKQSLVTGDFKTLKYKGNRIVLQGKVGYAGGRKIPRYICKLNDAKIVSRY